MKLDASNGAGVSVMSDKWYRDRGRFRALFRLSAKLSEFTCRRMLFLLAVCAVFVVTFVACGGGADDAPSPSVTELQVEASTPTPKGQGIPSSDPRTTALPTRTPVPTPTWIPAGYGRIYSSDPTAERDHDGVDYRSANHWWADLDGVIAIYGAQLADEEEQGLVVAQVLSGSYSYDPRDGAYLTRWKSGGLKVVGADGAKVQLESTSGEMFVFDAIEGRFISPYLDPLPTRRPTPTCRKGCIPTPIPLAPVGLVSIDVDVRDRALDEPLAIRSYETCRTAAVGERIEVDVILEGVPRLNGGLIEVHAFEFRLTYDPAVLVAVGTNSDMWLDFDARSGVYLAGGIGGPIASGEVAVRAGARNISLEVDSGVLTRIAFEAIGQGISEMTVTSGGLIDSRGILASFEKTAPGVIAVGGDCP